VTQNDIGPGRESNGAHDATIRHRPQPQFLVMLDTGETPATDPARRHTGDMPTPAVSTRDATMADAEAIRAIYNAEVSTGTASLDVEPRSIEAQQAWMEQRSGAHLVIVAALESGEIAGFASLSRYKEKHGYLPTVENSVYVHPDHQRKGVGQKLMKHLLELAADHGFHSIIARISAENDGSVLLHETVGFEHIGREREVGRKFGRWVDIVVMQYML